MRKTILILMTLAAFTMVPADAMAKGGKAKAMKPKATSGKKGVTINTGPRGKGAGYNNALPMGGRTGGLLKKPATMRGGGPRRAVPSATPGTKERQFQRQFAGRKGAAGALKSGQRAQTRRQNLRGAGVRSEIDRAVAPNRGALRHQGESTRMNHQRRKVQSALRPGKTTPKRK
jgi:hypothetical protein